MSEFVGIKKKNELYHHGILGQKWGKKNGPPYPLDAEDHSAAEKKKGWRVSLSEKKKRWRESLAKKKLYKSAKKVSSNSSYFNIKRFDTNLRNSVSDEQKAKLTALNKKWNSVAKEVLEADDKLYSMVDNDHSIKEIRKANPELAKKVDMGRKIWDEYEEELYNTANTILGKYANENITTITHRSKTYINTIVQSGESYVEDALHHMAYTDWYSSKLERIKTNHR